jgi:hypothetical protein
MGNPHFNSLVGNSRWLSMPTKLWLILLAACFVRGARLAAGVTANADFFVATNGNDSWSGRLEAPNPSHTDGPFASIVRAQAAVRALAKARPNHPITVMMRGGTYYLPLSRTESGTIRFSARDSGSARARIRWVNYPGEAPIISGGVPVGKGGLNLTWTPVAGHLWQVRLPANIQPFESLYYNGQRRMRSRLESPLGTGYYMRGGACYSTQTRQAVSTSQCNLGAFLRIAGTVSPKGPDGAGCPIAANTADGREKCLDRFYYNPNDPVAAWGNLTPTNTEWHECKLPSSSSYPEGDIEVTIFDAWTVDVMRVSCVDPARHIIYFTGKTFFVPGDYNFFGPRRDHRYMVENTKDAFIAARRAGQTGLWFLDRSTSPWTLNYITNRGEDPNKDSVVIPQLKPLSAGQGNVIESLGLRYATFRGSLVSAIRLRYLTFRGLAFEMDNYLPPLTGFNNDENTEFSLPAAVDCESCQHVTFDDIVVRHTSATGIVIASESSDSGAAAKDDSIENSAFYDIGDSGIRIGQGPRRGDKRQNVAQFVTVQNNIIQGYARVFPDGEGIALANGHDVRFVHNDIDDGYHIGLAVCFYGCKGENHKANGSNVLAAYNHIWNTMEGITSDGGTLYYNVGDEHGSATGDKILNNLVHDTTDASIIDPHGYGGRGIYLDSQTAGVTVANNVVYRVSQVLWMTEGEAPGEPANVFHNNILAYGYRSMFHEAGWPEGCADPSLRASITDNIFYFDRSETSGFHVVRGCSYSCGLPYRRFLNFQGNLYWRTDGKFASDAKAFHILTNPPADARRCGWSRSAQTYLSFAEWQSKQRPASWGPPGGMNLDTTGTAKVNPNFGNTGKPSDFLLSKSPIAGFDYARTNDTILHAGRSNPVIMPPTVPQTYPTYSYSEKQF